MALLKIAIFCTSLMAPVLAVASDGILASWDPTSIRETLSQGTSVTVPLTFTYDNSNASVAAYLVFIQDNSGCPKSPSTHSWIPMSVMSGSIPEGQAGQVMVNVSLNSNGLAVGIYRTNVCFVADDATNPTNVAVPVILKVVSPDVIFLDGFE